MKKWNGVNSLGGMAATGMWPTPSANKQTASGDLINADGTPWDGKGKPHSAKTGKPVQTALLDKVRVWPTPSSGGVTGGPTGLSGGSGNRQKLYSMMGEEQGKKMGCGQLNPDWVEGYLMGWPYKWSSLEPMPMEVFDAWLFIHGKHAGTQKSQENVQSGNMRAMQRDEAFDTSSSRQKSRQQQTRECSDSLQIVPRDASCQSAMEQQADSSSLFLVRQDFSIQPPETNNVLAFLRQQVGMVKEIRRIEEEGIKNGENVCRKAVAWIVDPADIGDIPRVAIGTKNRTQRLKAIGNGQVPAVAALAWRILSDGII